MPQIIISGTVIEFPDTAQSPDWSEGLILFAETVAAALSGIVGPGDVSPQVLVINAYNSPGFIDIPNLAFSTATVRTANIRYGVFRSTNTTTVFEEGDMQLIYDNTSGTWGLTRERTGDGNIDFDVTNAGQVRFSVQTIPGTGYTGTLVYTAVTLQQF
jgi:hypothetical protein